MSGLAGCEFHARTFDFPCLEVHPRPALHVPVLNPCTVDSTSSSAV